MLLVLSSAKQVCPRTNKSKYVKLGLVHASQNLKHCGLWLLLIMNGSLVQSSTPESVTFTKHTCNRVNPVFNEARVQLL